MSREKDLIDLIRTANEVYLINPSNNVRTAYILIDDLCELMTKFFLQLKDKAWKAEKANGHFKKFTEITDEVRAKHQGNGKVDRILTNFDSRRRNRNSFFHDHQMTGLTVSNENCLEAFCDLYDLLDILFPNAVKNNKTALYMAQVASIKVLRECVHDYEIKTKYLNLLRNWEHNENKKTLKAKGEFCLVFPNSNYEYCIIHYNSQRFYDALLTTGLINS